MEQTPSSSGRSPELPSVSPNSSGETLGAISDSERKPGDTIENLERQAEVVSSAEQAAAAPTAPVSPLSFQPSDQVVSDVATPPAVDMPAVANDDDLIEKEWVEKAKKILAETKDDPYRREQEVNRLQADYLQKRYGRTLGSAQ